MSTNTVDRTENLATKFLNNIARFPDRPAVSMGKDSISYTDLGELAFRISATLRRGSVESEPPLTGVFGHRSFVAFGAILGSLIAGRTYVPLNPDFPLERTTRMIEKAGLRRIVAEKASLKALCGVLSHIARPLLVLVPDATDAQALNLPLGCSHHKFQLAVDLAPRDDYFDPSVADDRLAYLLFTSGSTGDPKGVMVSHANVNHFIDVMTSRYEITEADRFSQTFDLTFDLSVFDMFVAWACGACVCCPTRGEKLLPGKYVSAQRITIWFSVPSTAIMMRKLKMLKPAQYPEIRYSLFCGEALPLDVAAAFQRAAPNSIVENLYGPTELTIACTLYRYSEDQAAAESELGVVPIGNPYPGMKELIVDESLGRVPLGQPGELLMAGPQVAKGYWQDQEKTDTSFVVPPGYEDTYYRTGDRVKRQSKDAPLLYLGRVDSQIKVQGYRVELGEIEAALRAAAKVDTAIAQGYPEGINGAEGIVAFVAESTESESAVREVVQRRLPSYMQPTEIFWMSSFPLNANGKVDRGALIEMRASGALDSNTRTAG